MQPVHIHVVGAEAAQRAFESPVNLLAAIAAGVGVAFLGVEAEFGGQHQLVAAGAFGHETAHQLLALAARIDVGRIDEIAAGLYIGVEYFPRNSFRSAPARGAEGHGTEGERTDDEAGAAQGAKIGELHSRGVDE